MAKAAKTRTDKNPPVKLRQLVVLFGDQLDRAGPWRDGFDSVTDAVWMAEAGTEAEYVWSHKQRIVLFLSAMRHFRDELQESGVRVYYRQLQDGNLADSLFDLLEKFLQRQPVEQVVWVWPGEYRIRQQMIELLKRTGQPHQCLEDSHFYATPADFARHAKGRKSLRMEYFYREMRQREKVLLTEDGQPEGGQWNFDADNRGSFGRAGPDSLPVPKTFAPDETTREVIALVNKLFPSHPGDTDTFAWPVTPSQAESALEDFIEHRLPHFGQFQDALWAGEPFLYHSLLSAAMNLKLLNPRRVVLAAGQAYRAGHVPLAAAEGFIRQILGWREYVRGVYWLKMPQYLELNAMAAEQPLPDFYWTAETEMACLADAIGQTMRYGYAHHIQRLMVTGLYALLLGVRPQEVHAWYLAVYVDAVEWVELPNTLGMSQYGDGGIMASKPYVATGKYIQRMSNHCANCRYDPAQSVGPKACPFTTLYWDYLLRHRTSLQKNPRMALQVRNLQRLSDDQKTAIQSWAEQHKKAVTKK